MSRTIRRKNFAAQMGKVSGSKTALTYTYPEWHWAYSADGQYWHWITYRPMDAAELKSEMLRRHSDKWDRNYRNGRSVIPKIARVLSERAYRSKCSAKIKAFMHGLTDDVVLPKLETNHSAWW